MRPRAPSIAMGPWCRFTVAGDEREVRMLVSHILKEKGRNVLAIPSDATLGEVARVLTANRIGALVVLDEQGGCAGLISDRDIVRALAEQGPPALALTVGAAMVRDTAT